MTLKRKELKRKEQVLIGKNNQKAKDAELVTRFVEWYCAAHHTAAQRLPLESSGVDAGVYGARIPLLCKECAEYVRYAEQRTELCRIDPKPFCTVCAVKCYNPEMAEYSRMIMRYSGPRSLRSRYCLRALQHMLVSRRFSRRYKKRHRHVCEVRDDGA